MFSGCPVVNLCCLIDSAFVGPFVDCCDRHTNRHPCWKLPCVPWLADDNDRWYFQTENTTKINYYYDRQMEMIKMVVWHFFFLLSVAITVQNDVGKGAVCKNFNERSNCRERLAGYEDEWTHVEVELPSITENVRSIATHVFSLLPTCSFFVWRSSSASRPSDVPCCDLANKYNRPMSTARSTNDSFCGVAVWDMHPNVQTTEETPNAHVGWCSMSCQ